MQNAAFLLISVVIMAVGLLVIAVWNRSRRPREHDGIEQFRAAIHALSTHGSNNRTTSRRRKQTR